MSKLLRIFGIPMVVAGTLFLAVAYVAGWTRWNGTLLIGGAMIVVGAVVYVVKQKRSGGY